MKNGLAVIILLLITSCSIKSQFVSGIEYRIIKIDSIKNIYLIYAEKSSVVIKDTDIIKIASIKSKNKCEINKLIINNKKYKFNLTSLYPKNFVSHHYLGGITFNEIFVPFEKDYNVKKDLFTTEDLEGLCYKH